MKHYHLPQVIHEYEDCIVEACMRCGQRFTFYKNKITGRLQDYGWQKLELEDAVYHIKVHGDNYAEVHARDFLQPYGATKMDYIQEYGYEAYESSLASHKKVVDTEFAKADNKEKQNAIQEVLDLRKKKRNGDIFFT